MTDYETINKQIWARKMQAADLVRVAKYERVEKASGVFGTDEDPMKVYEVVVGKGSSRVVLGRVEQTPHTSYRHCGNLVSQTFNMVEWEPSYVPGVKNFGLTHRTRKEAALRMVENFLTPKEALFGR
jgi:hypothetical protein